MSKNSKKGFLATLGSWFSRTFMGASKSLADEMELTEEEKRQRAREADVEEIVSPVKQIVRNFFQRKLAVVAVIGFLTMFLFVFIGPLFFPTYSDTYTETTQKSVPPGFNMMSVPKELKNDIKEIDTYGTFSVGLSNAGNVYVWGQTLIGTSKIDVSVIPQEVIDANIVHVAAGIDHIVAIGDDGTVYAWGNNRLGQYGYFDPAQNPNILPMPEELLNGKIDVANVDKVECGYQCTAILMKDGSFYLWGNKNAYQNIQYFENYTGKIKDIAFALNDILAVPEAANSIYTGMRGTYAKVRTSLAGAATSAVSISEHLNGRKIEALCATNTMVCLTLDDGSICFAGNIDAGLLDVPKLPAGETWVDVQSGTYHFTGLTSSGNVYSWGSNILGQCKTPSKISGVSEIHVGSFQNYAVNEDDSLINKWGLSGYLFGTDTRGADLFARVVNGGKMTMTVGAVAVIISTIIGIIIGCISGYFGGKVDMLLMRVTEIVAAIPFLPFAMILSALMGRMTISENMRIFIIMCILGVLSWTGLARIVRGQVLAARENEYVTAAKSMGVKEGTIAFKHILPNVISVIIVTLTLDFAGCMLTESSLSYLGFGVQYPRPTWGNMLNGANNSTIIKNFWWQWFFPGLFLAITTICINIIGDTLRDVMDPKSSAER
ncbi:MAG: ABC transporter permease subunit [Clostridia bacterium]|nr:ABC transporter permease subunit [Clostridia bacterium]MBQ6809542.1 ABC transporter permease subunit [Clostridia bacterium]